MSRGRPRQLFALAGLGLVAAGCGDGAGQEARRPELHAPAGLVASWRVASEQWRWGYPEQPIPMVFQGYTPYPFDLDGPRPSSARPPTAGVS